MRILHCIPSLGGGGAERQLSYLANELVRLGHAVHIAYLQPGANYSHFTSRAGITLHRLVNSPPSSNTGRNWVNYDPRVCFRLLRIIQRLRPDVVQTWAPQMHILAGAACTLLRIPWGLREAANKAAYPDGWKSSFTRWVGQKATFIVSNSIHGDRYWAEMGYVNDHFVIRNCVGVQEIDAAAPAAPGYRHSILFAGRFEAEKNIFAMVRALIEAFSLDASLTALLCGDGPLRAEAERLVDRHALADRIRFAGFRLDLWSLMKSSDLLISVSHFEGCPNSVLEAMACQCPVLVSDIPEHREILDSDTATFVDRHNISDIAAAILRTIADPDRKARASRARQIVERMSVEEMARQYESLYEQVSRSTRIPEGEHAIVP